MNVPKDMRYAETHEWAKKTDKGIMIGITDYAQHELSDVVFVELPAVGKTVKKGETICVAESVKAAADIYAPVSGTVVEVNSAVANEPALVNKDPYGQAWLVVLKPSKMSEFDALMSPDAYEKHIGG